MAKLRKRRGLFTGVRTVTGDLKEDVFPALRGFHAPQKDRLRQPMPPRVTNKQRREQIDG